MVTAACTARRMMLSIANIQWGLIKWFLKILFTYNHKNPDFWSAVFFQKQEFLPIQICFYSEMKVLTMLPWIYISSELSLPLS